MFMHYFVYDDVTVFLISGFPLTWNVREGQDVDGKVREFS